MNINISSLSNKAASLEKEILKKCNFFPLWNRLDKTLQGYGYAGVKEYVRFIIIKYLVEENNLNQDLYPPPFICSFWLVHVLDTVKYQNLCDTLKKRIHFNQDDYEEISNEERIIGLYNTIKLYDILFANQQRNQSIWDDQLLNQDDDNNKQLILVNNNIME